MIKLRSDFWPRIVVSTTTLVADSLNPGWPAENPLPEMRISRAPADELNVSVADNCPASCGIKTTFMRMLSPAAKETGKPAVLAPKLALDELETLSSFKTPVPTFHTRAFFEATSPT